MGSFFFRLKVTLKMILTYIFYFPGLVLHEGSHALAAFLTFSKIVSIKLIPSIKFAPDNSSYTIIYGYVKSVASYQMAYMAIGLAPLTLWLIPLAVADYNNWVSLSPFSINFEKIFRLNNWFFFLLVAQIAWAGFPSSQDWKVFFHGLFSISGVLFICTAFVFYFFDFQDIFLFLRGII